MKGLVLAGIFFLLAPITLATSLFSLELLGKFDVRLPKSTLVSASSFIDSPKSGVRVYASLPGNLPGISGEAVASDARPYILEAYMQRYNSPLAPYAERIVKTADTYALDYKLITAIAQQESNLCKKIPPSTFNCWGWGIHSEGTLGFDSFDQGIEIVSRGLREEYLDKGYTTPDEIMTKYTPLSPGSWADGVNKFLSDMEQQ